MGQIEDSENCPHDSQAVQRDRFNGGQTVPDRNEAANRLRDDSACFSCWIRLTFFGVEEDLHLTLLGPEQSLGQLGQGVLLGAGTDQEGAGAGLLHDLCSGEAEHLAEALVAVDDPTVLHLGVGDQKPAI